MLWKQTSVSVSTFLDAICIGNDLSVVSWLRLPLESYFKALACWRCAAGYLKSPFSWRCSTARQFVAVSLSRLTIQVLVSSQCGLEVRVSHLVSSPEVQIYPGLRWQCSRLCHLFHIKSAEHAKLSYSGPKSKSQVVFSVLTSIYSYSFNFLQHIFYSISATKCLLTGCRCSHEAIVFPHCKLKQENIKSPHSPTISILLHVFIDNEFSSAHACSDLKIDLKSLPVFLWQLAEMAAYENKPINCCFVMTTVWYKSAWEKTCKVMWKQ